MDEEALAYSTQDEAVAAVIQGLAAGDLVTIHEDGCSYDEAHDCTCEPLAVWGPSGQA